jgi:hypothetical protein
MRQRRAVSIRPLDLPDFLREHRLVIVAVHRGGGRLPVALLDPLIERYTDMVGGAKVDLAKIEFDDPAVAMWVQWRNEELGRAADARVAPGYYLFMDERIAAYHPGAVDLDGVGGLGLFASIVGALTGERAVERFGQVLMDVPLSKEVASFFQSIIDEWVQAELRRGFATLLREFGATGPQEEQAREEVAVRAAMKRLGIPEQATQPEAKKMWRQLARTFHPDSVSGDPAKRVAHEVFVELEGQWQLICAHKGWK